MFVTCPNCKELVGNHVGPCPMCKHMITAEYILKYEQEERREGEAYTREKMAIFSERKARANLLTLFMFVAIIATAIIFRAKDQEVLRMVVVLVELVIYCIISHFTKCFDCPYCGKYYKAYVSRGISFQTDCCPHCGGRLR